MMRRVVCCDRIDRTVLQTLNDGKPVFLCSERRMHLEVGIIIDALVVCQCEIVGACLSRNLDSPCLGVPDHADAALSADVADMYRDIEIFGQNDVSGDHDVLGCSRDPPDADGG